MVCPAATSSAATSWLILIIWSSNSLAARWVSVTGPKSCSRAWVCRATRLVGNGQHLGKVFKNVFGRGRHVTLVGLHGFLGVAVGNQFLDLFGGLVEVLVGLGTVLNHLDERLVVGSEGRQPLAVVAGGVVLTALKLRLRLHQHQNVLGQGPVVLGKTLQLARQIERVGDAVFVKPLAEFHVLVVFRTPGIPGGHKLLPHFRLFGSLGKRLVDGPSRLVFFASRLEVVLLALAHVDRKARECSGFASCRECFRCVP